jgi:hypothetical protein
MRVLSVGMNFRKEIFSKPHSLAIRAVHEIE